jgi:hypothetical protein
MDFRTKIYRIADSIWLGPFASPERKQALTSANITHILNVSEAPSVLSIADGPFRNVVWHPIVDLELMMQASATDCLMSLHSMVSEPSARVYVHCIAGLNRSPTIAWLYLVACGLLPRDATLMIEKRAPDSIAPHKKLVDAKLIDAVRKLGAEHFLPHPRTGALSPPD